MNNSEKNSVRLLGTLASSSIYDEAFLSCSDGYCVFDADDTLTAYSNTFPKLYPPVEHDIHLGLSYADYMRLFVAKKAIQNLGDPQDLHDWVVKRLDPANDRSSFLHHLHSGRWVEIKVHKVSTGERLFVAFDVTNLIQHREQLLENQDKFKTYASLSSDWFWELDENLRYVYHSSHRTPLAQGNGSSLEGLSRLETMSSAVKNEEFDRHHDCLKNRQEVDVVLTWVDSIGRKIFSQIKAEPQYDREGEFSGYIGCGRDITDHMLLAEQLQQHARFDYLTGNLNKRAFEVELEKCSRMRNPANKQTLCLIDLDRFKIVNDESGHAAGDVVLKKLGVFFKRALGDDSIIGRIGGDEFGVVLNHGVEDSVKKIEILIESISQMQFQGKKRMHTIGASVGLVAIDQSLSTRDLLSRADQACYSAKNGGRNCVRRYGQHNSGNATKEKASNITQLSPQYSNEKHAGKVSETKLLVAIVANGSNNAQEYLTQRIGKTLRQEGMASVTIVVNRVTVARLNSSETPYPGLLENYRFAGVIALSDNSWADLSEKEFSAILSSANSAPVVSIGSVLDDFDSICVDEEQAMNDLVSEHFQNRTPSRFSFIGGCPKHAVSSRREEMFRQNLQDRGVKVNEALVVNGISENEVYTAVSRYIDDGYLPEVVIASDVEKARAAYKAFQAHGIRVPEDIVVAGFDDGFAELDSHEAFSTVRVDADELAFKAAYEISKKIADSGLNKASDRPKQHVLKGRLCSQDAGANQSGIDVVRDTDSLAPSSDCGKYDEIDHCFRDEWWASRLAKNDNVSSLEILFRKLILDGNREFSNVIFALTAGEGDDQCDNWGKQEALEKLQRAIGNYFKMGQSEIESLEGLNQLILFITKLNDKIHILQKLSHSRKLQYQQLHENLHYLLLSVQTIDEVCEALEMGLPECGIERAFMVLQRTDRRVSSDSHLVFAMVDGKRVNQAEVLFSASALLPDSLLHEVYQSQLLLYSLGVNGDEFGYLLLDHSSAHALQLNRIEQSVSASIQNCYQILDRDRRAEELREINGELAQRSQHDPVTGLPNQDQFVNQIESVLFESDRRKLRTALIQINLIGFKQLSESCGVSNVSYVLRTLASRLQETCGHNVQLFKLGESEFAAIVRLEKSDDSAEDIAGKLVDLIREPCEVSGQNVSVPVAAGIAYYPEHGNEGDSLCVSADTAARHASSLGLNVVTTYNASMSDSVLDKWQLDQDMRRGLNRDEFVLHYQPRINVQSGQIESFEALLRWFPLDGDGQPLGTVGPYIFVPVAEETGLITKLSDFALNTACEQLGRWRDLGLNTRVSVNLSTMDLCSQDLVDRVTKPLLRHSLSTESLEVEVTETAAMGDIETSISRLQDLRDIGIEVAIDDFGTSYSSLNYLKRLPAGYLKIDRSFVMDIDSADGGDSADAAIVRAIVALGHSLNYRIVAEGVETIEQFRYLESLGCDEVQGYYFSKPVDSVTAERMLREQKNSAKSA